jgi:hypothetical protein
MNPIDKTFILKQVVDYLDKNGINVDLKDLESNVKVSSKFKFKVNKCEKKIKFKVSTKNKQILSLSVYNTFANICRDNNIVYFRFNDEYDWVGPAIKVDEDDSFDLKLFQGIDIHVLDGYGFSIIRPTKQESDLHLSYDFSQYNHCKINHTENNCIFSDNESNSFSESECIDTEDWFFDPTNTLYQLDTNNNNLYSNQTYEFIGRKIDDHTIDFEAKES